ncbi:uncharacterized protein METZ01_LOCUS448659, partial [marine metagenome]
GVVMENFFSGIFTLEKLVVVFDF